MNRIIISSIIFALTFGCSSEKNMSDPTKEVSFSTGDLHTNSQALVVESLTGARYSMRAYNDIVQAHPNPDDWAIAREKILHIEPLEYQNSDVAKNQQLLYWYRYLQDYMFEVNVGPEVCNEIISTLQRVHMLGNAIEWDILAKAIVISEDCGNYESIVDIRNYVEENITEIKKDESYESLGPNYNDALLAEAILQMKNAH